MDVPYLITVQKYSYCPISFVGDVNKEIKRGRSFCLEHGNFGKAFYDWALSDWVWLIYWSIGFPVGISLFLCTWCWFHGCIPCTTHLCTWNSFFLRQIAPLPVKRKAFLMEEKRKMSQMRPHQRKIYISKQEEVGPLSVLKCLWEMT